MYVAEMFLLALMFLGDSGIIEAAAPATATTTPKSTPTTATTKKVTPTTTTPTSTTTTQNPLVNLTKELMSLKEKMELFKGVEANLTGGIEKISEELKNMKDDAESENLKVQKSINVTLGKGVGELGSLKNELKTGLAAHFKLDGKILEQLNATGLILASGLSNITKIMLDSSKAVVQQQKQVEIRENNRTELVQNLTLKLEQFLNKTAGAGRSVTANSWTTLLIISLLSYYFLC